MSALLNSFGSDRTRNSRSDGRRSGMDDPDVRTSPMSKNPVNVNSAMENCMRPTIRMLFYLFVFSTLTVPAAGTTIKTSYVIDDGQGFWSTDAPHTGEYAEGNPGTTLGEQRKFAHEYHVMLYNTALFVGHQRNIPRLSKEGKRI